MAGMYQVQAVLDFLSSSSSENEEELVSYRVLEEIPKIKNFIEDVVHKSNEKQFQSNFRIKRETACILIQGFENSNFFPKDVSHGGKIPIAAEAQVLSFLWFAANKSSLRDVAQRFNMATSTLFKNIDNIMDYLLDLAPEVIKLPNSAAEKNHIASGFKKVSGFPGVLGCIDGTSINVRTPKHKIKSTYTNRHDLPSITLQAICDHNKCFIDIFTGVPGKVHDARVLKLSDVNTILPELCGNKYHILGDGAYSIRNWLLIPYKDFGSLTAKQIQYNKIFCSTRVSIENAFGILKGRFRQLSRVDMHSVQKITKFIVACCVLHNMCINHNDQIDDSDIINEPGNCDDQIREDEWQLRRIGEQKRDAIKDILQYIK